MAIVWIVLVLPVFVHHISGDTLSNIALDKTARMSSMITGFGPEKAVDGNTTAVYPLGIIDTGRGHPYAWWSVHLRTEVKQATVEVYFRTDYTRRRNGVGLYTSAVYFSSYPEGQSCYNVTGSHDGSDINSTLSVICPGTWSFLMVYTATANDDEGPVLDFGEVRVLVCSTGYYGSNCDKSCSSRQCAVTPTSCDRYSGACPFGGCNAGWRGIDCTEECHFGKYGANCSKECDSRQCSVTPTSCDHISGACLPAGCKAGWMGVACTKDCIDGTYGSNCERSCSDRQCRSPSSSCDRETGHCPEGCLDGWREVDCASSIPCPVKKYGVHCELDCGQCSGTCDRVDGHCPGGCMEGYSGTACLTSSLINIVPIVAGAAAGLVVIIIIVVAFFVWKRRRSKSGNRQPTVTINESTQGHKRNNAKPVLRERTAKAKEEELNIESTVDVEPEEEIMEEDDGLPLSRDYYNDSAEVIREIRVEDLEATVQKIRSNEGSFEAEYCMLPTGFSASYADSQKPENSSKNKYIGYYPYDYNRVRLSLLPNIPGSDYINASFIHNYNQKKTYIAAQAPKRKTVDDFWRMIWEQRCERIIMLTNLVEDMRIKCYKYWPDEGGLHETNHFRIEVKVMNTRANYTLRHLKITSKQSGECRSVAQYHFTSWPDHGVPDTLALVHFIWIIRQLETQTDESLLVHCSAGIGRTGTYIAVDSLLDQARGEGVVDVLGYVTLMRGKRKNMIQTKDQYECVFNCLVEMTKFGNTSMNVDNFITSYTTRGMDSMVDRKTLRELTQLVITEDYNRNCHRMWVDGNQDFIVRVGPSLIQLRGYLMAVVSSPGLDKLLWKLVKENNVHNVIVISQLQTDLVGEKGKTNKHGGITLKTTGQSNLTSDLVQTTLRLQMKASACIHDVKMFKLGCNSTLDDMSSFLLIHVHLHHLFAEISPVVIVHSDANAKLAVLFCIMGNILSGILQDRCVDVVGHLRSFLKCCPKVTIKEQELVKLFDFAKDCVQMTESEKTYASV